MAFIIVVFTLLLVIRYTSEWKTKIVEMETRLHAGWMGFIDRKMTDPNGIAGK